MAADRNLKLLQFIKDQKLNQTSFAAAIGVDRQTVISWLNRTKSTSYVSLCGIAAKFDRDPIELNEELELGVEIPSSETAITKLKAQFKEEIELLHGTVSRLNQKIEKVEEWFALPSKAVNLFDKERESNVNRILGVMRDSNLTLLDALVETPLTVQQWQIFLVTGEIDKENLDELYEWLGLLVEEPVNTHR